MAPLAHPAPCPGQEVPGQPFRGPERSGGLPSQRLAVWGGAENMPGPGLKAGVSSSHTETDRPRIYPTYTMGCPTVPRRRGQVGPRWQRVALSPGDPAADTQRSSLRKCSQQSQVCSWVPPTWCPQPHEALILQALPTPVTLAGSPGRCGVSHRPPRADRLLRWGS